MKKTPANKKYSWIAFATIFAMLAIPLTACAEKPSQNNDSTTQAASEQSTQETTEERLYADLPDEDFGGTEFMFLARRVDGADWTDWVPRDLYAENENGEAINDAVYKRNRIIEEKFNVKINQYYTNNANSDLKKAVNAGDTTYSAAVVGLGDSTSMAQQGLFQDLNENTYLDLSQPYWDQNANKSLSIGGKLFMTAGDLLVMDNDATAAIVFNKKLISDYGLESPYTLVKENKWTMDKMFEMCKGVAKDLNGDGKMDFEDSYGLIAQRDSVISFYHGADEVLCTKDENDLPVYNFGTNRQYSVLDKTYDIMYAEDTTINLHLFESKYAIYAEQTKLFSSNKALFSWIRMRVVETLRAMDADFGILPHPKFDVAQENYGHTVSKYTSNVIGIPVGVDADRSGIILEALACESKYTLEKAYYDINLIGKFARDEDSKEMLDIIFSSTVYDIGEIYNFGDFGGTLIYMTMTKKRDVVSTYEKVQARIQTAIDKCVAAYGL
ncbi:MAG: hypothetical protein AB9835_04190 [Eubacteriales bacterium]